MSLSGTPVCLSDCYKLAFLLYWCPWTTSAWFSSLSLIATWRLLMRFLVHIWLVSVWTDRLEPHNQLMSSFNISRQFTAFPEAAESAVDCFDLTACNIFISFTCSDEMVTHCTVNKPVTWPQIVLYSWDEMTASDMFGTVRLYCFHYAVIVRHQSSAFAAHHWLQKCYVHSMQCERADNQPTSVLYLWVVKWRDCKVTYSELCFCSTSVMLSSSASSFCFCCP